MRVLAALAILLFPITVHAESLTGYYEITKPNGVVVPDGEGEICDTELSMAQTCVQSIETKDVLALQEKEHGDLVFATHISFFNGHSCSIRGLAKKDGDRWVFNAPLSVGDLSEYGVCELEIYLEDGSVVLNSQFEDEISQLCRSNYCGMRGHLNNIKFPKSSKVREAISDHELKCIGIYSDECENE